ncbi:hypothetical protein MNBD_GAMMA10-2256 [hydrothermal vent metagenome]|uniref:OmpA-like domain-containing protein n=1 Tax=hydrothermal vent metagenome TaxID=652676 RepID=A0A3B0XSL8_9ZZZZ
MKNLINKPGHCFNAKYPRSSLLLAGLSLLVLGGCAGSTSVKSNMDTPLVENEAQQSAAEEQGFRDPVYSQLVDDNNQQEPIAENQNNSVLQGDDTLVNETPPVTDVADTKVSELDKEVTPEPGQNMISFAFNQSDVSAEYGELLWQYAQYLKENENMILSVSGHTDSSGVRVYNEKLSQKRADQVAQILVDFGVPEDRVLSTGMGSEEPLVDAVLNREHRRVELQLSDVEEVMFSSVE